MLKNGFMVFFDYYLNKKPKNDDKNIAEVCFTNNFVVSQILLKLISIKIALISNLQQINNDYNCQ